MDLRHWVEQAVSSIQDWSSSFGVFEGHPALAVDDADFGKAFGELITRLGDNYPYGHPRYAGQMLKPPHPAAIVGYLAAMQINPNNHALDGGPATSAMEKEVVAALATMFGFGEHLGHLTTSGTIANLEALFVARELHPSQGVAYSAEAHYTHPRMLRVLGVEGYEVPVDDQGRMDLDALETLLLTGKVGTVVLTTGTTGLGAIDPIHEALVLRERYGVRIHVDAAYGGFFTLLAGAELPLEPWRAIASCDSVVVDPHKHGLQPYGCGAVLFSDPAVGRFYLHDSPYTYFTSDNLHLGEISLECSRAGAAAAALWLTFRLLPPTPDGLGRSLAAGIRAARGWADLIESSSVLTLYQRPSLDIVSYFPSGSRLSDIDPVSDRVMHEGMTGEDPVFLSTLRVSAAAMAARHPSITPDADATRILRSVLMKPEQEAHFPHLHARVESLARP